MNINKSVNGDSTVLAVEGRLDTATAPQFEKEIEETVTETADLVLDFANLEYTSSAGLRVILKAQKAMSKVGQMKLINVNEEVMEVFKITGFTDILTIE
ncbi:MAG: STAS domain-containing protein [Firmicutes bacterium]|nr:STAS domain-containing protein [Bacillota bacterium]